MKRKIKKILNKISYIFAGVFLISLTVLFYGWIQSNIKIILIISGLLVLISILFGSLSFKKLLRRIVKKLS